MKLKYISVFKNETFCLSKHPYKDEFWLYDYVRGYNLSMGAKSEQEAFIEALLNYQKRLKEVEIEFKTLKDKVDIFIEGIVELED